MSDDLYNRWWITTRQQLEKLRNEDAILEQTAPSLTERLYAHHFIGDLYCQYVKVMQKLSTCLDQSFMIQKCFTMKKLMDAAVVRLTELRELFVKEIHFSEYFYLDENLLERKLIPHSIEIVDPGFVFDRPIEIEDLWTAIKNGERIYEPPPPEPESESLENEGETEIEVETEAEAEVEIDVEFFSLLRPPVPVFHPPPVVTLTPSELMEIERRNKFSEIVLSIQIHERARQARIYYGDAYAKHNDYIRLKEKVLKPPILFHIQANAAITIQKHWRGYRERKRFKKRELDRRLLIGMTEPSWKSKKVQVTFEQIKETRRAYRYQKLREFIATEKNEHERLLRVVGGRLMEDISDEIREWFRRCYNDHKKFDKFPPEELGGSILIVREETTTNKEQLDQGRKLLTGKDKKNAAKEKKALEKAAKEKKKKEKEIEKKKQIAAKLRERNGELLIKLQPSIAAEKFIEGFTEQRDYWDRKPLKENPFHKPDMEIIRDKKCYDLQLEIRIQVDVLMRIELILLNKALCRDEGRKYKAPPIPKAKKEKKKGKKKGNEQEQSPVGRCIEDVFQELVDNGVIRTYPKAKLSDFKGDYSYSNFEKRQQFLDPLPTLGDIRSAVMMNCILPLGVENMDKPKAVLIAGPPQSGKHLLANAIFNETRCVLFDISPPVLAGKYKGKKEVALLVDLINRLARVLQPSIIFIDGGEKPFYKKVPKEEKRLEPKKMGGVLHKSIIKKILPEDKILVLAISDKPFSAKRKIIKVFNRIILVPRPDYNSVYMYWRELLMSYHQLDRNFNASELAYVTQNYPLPFIKSILEKVLTPTRTAELPFKPLDSLEIMDVLLEEPEPLNDENWAKYEKWFSKTLLNKKRRKLLKIEKNNRAKQN
ncbi:hypothetical protein FQA39_LY09556 [Lamprigera yunnana]|nr:hypothetical protein FQA39_LY09556 [Lamprigera yunnana]